jgi:hypothetical protein
MKQTYKFHLKWIQKTVKSKIKKGYRMTAVFLNHTETNFIF